MTRMTNVDIARLRTRDLQTRFDSSSDFSGDFNLMPSHLIEFVRPAIARGEKMVASAPCDMAIWDAPGDGTYYSSGVPVVATGFANRYGTNFMLGTVAGNLAGNAWNRRKAEALSQKRWMAYIPQGMLTISTCGFYIDHEDGQFWRGWHDLDKVDWIEPSKVEIRTQGAQNQVRFQLISDWAELLYVLWVRTATGGHHPRKYDWISPNLQTIPLDSYPEYGTGAESVHSPAARGPEAHFGQANANLALIFSLISLFFVFFLVPTLIFGPLAVWQSIEAKKKGNMSRRRVLGMLLGGGMLLFVFVLLIAGLLGYVSSM
ncbi:hypothetical protein LTI14_02215 [Nesterenkonia sp. YGD6]|uniref:hypothetical protein n=1 Tax=Nesterenkonia sp. YGD6 TaxID=2901231 RepID=UPI001F4C77BF|nr:hypothetical protein [Nesterenkonia sp. YGD6]MCH8562038.1 hypothetical protein [Nesterenkonia sp. YGD6]